MKQIQPNRRRDFLFVLLGTIIGAGLSYFSGVDLDRLDLLRSTQRDAYVDFLRAQVELDLGRDREGYVAKTADARKRIAIYGSGAVVESLAHYWRAYSAQPACQGETPKWQADAAIFQSMRDGLVPFWDRISDADMMMLMYLCRIPK